jgi:hypothetical protein
MQKIKPEFQGTNCKSNQKLQIKKDQKRILNYYKSLFDCVQNQSYPAFDI